MTWGDKLAAKAAIFIVLFVMAIVAGALILPATVAVVADNLHKPPIVAAAP